VAHLLDDLGGEVLRGPTDGGRCFFLVEDLGEAEVRELDVADLVDDDVLGLEAVSTKGYSR
jgi:hypothetical protein